MGLDSMAGQYFEAGFPIENNEKKCEKGRWLIDKITGRGSAEGRTKTKEDKYYVNLDSN